MGKPLIMVASLTYAMKGKEILNKKGFSAEIQKTPKYNNPAGCGYSIDVPKDTDKAEQILIQNGIKVIGRAEKRERL